jgi:hypothetical protein
LQHISIQRQHISIQRPGVVQRTRPKAGPPFHDLVA